MIQMEKEELRSLLKGLVLVFYSSKINSWVFNIPILGYYIWKYRANKFEKVWMDFEPYFDIWCSALIKSKGTPQLEYLDDMERAVINARRSADNLFNNTKNN